MAKSLLSGTNTAWVVAGLLILAACAAGYGILGSPGGAPGPDSDVSSTRARESTVGRDEVGREAEVRELDYVPNRTRDSSGFFQTVAFVKPWREGASLEDVAAEFRGIGRRKIDELSQEFPSWGPLTNETVAAASIKSLLFGYEGEPEKAYDVLAEARGRVERDPRLAREWLYTIIYLQGVASLRKGETDNCVLCRGESSCILPISPAAVHQNPDGSRRAIAHFKEYLRRFPDDLEAKWLLNVAHMTLGEYPEKVDLRYLVSISPFTDSAHGIGRFRDVGHLVGVNRFNQSGGAIMEDFDGDGRLDVVSTTIDPTQRMAFYRNTGDGKFAEYAAEAGVAGELGGLNCVQTDYDNDGFVDILVLRGAWFASPIRPSLLKNRGDGSFVDVTAEAGLLAAVNSNSGAWGDYDNDGYVDLFVCCERQPNRLYHNERNGTFVEVAAAAGVQQDGEQFCKGGVWVDYDNDGYIDLFVNNLRGVGRLYRNSRDGSFVDVSAATKIDGPREGFPCWAFDFDNDGWLDIFAATYQYQRSAADVVNGMIGRPHEGESNRLFRNRGGTGFEDVTREGGLDVTLAAMGANYADFDNDGFLDMYLGTGAPGYNFLAPNRMFRNLGGRRFADITASSGTGHLQKGHGVACGDWDRDGDVDLFAQTGGPAPGDSFHNLLFQNPGQGNGWVNLRLVGVQSNRSAVGARLKVVTGGEAAATIHRHVSTGSSFGANSLEQVVGLGGSERVDLIEIRWPGGETQTFRDIEAGRTVTIVEGVSAVRDREVRPISITEP